jgi:hypothetical protein
VNPPGGEPFRVEKPKEVAVEDATVIKEDPIPLVDSDMSQDASDIDYDEDLSF